MPKKTVAKYIFSLIVALSLAAFSLFRPANTAHAYDILKPCEKPLSTNKLTQNTLDPISFYFQATGAQGAPVTIKPQTIEVDFSKIQSLYGPVNSDYMEGKYQDDGHRKINLTTINSADFNKFNGPTQKISPRVMLNAQKADYVKWVYKRGLPEVLNVYTDYNGENPKTLQELYEEFHEPNPPESGIDPTWDKYWGKYWAKIPTSPNEFTYGRLDFSHWYTEEPISACMNPRRQIYFVVPEFFRTASVANNLNRVVVPKAAQSYDKNLLASAANGAKNALSAAINCVKKPTHLSKQLRKFIKISLKQIKFAKNVYAQEDLSCSKILRYAKEGKDAFCGLPAKTPDGQNNLRGDEFCLPKNDDNQLDKANQNVICTFRIDLPPLRIGERVGGAGGDFDKCEPAADGRLKCYVLVRVFPKFYLPWSGTIWNNTTYSDSEEPIEGDTQFTGRPGVYTLFTPKSTQGFVFAKDLDKENITKNLPAKNDQPLDPKNPKERFHGAVQCNMTWDRDIALKPIALQKSLGVQQECESVADQAPPLPNPPGPTKPPTNLKPEIACWGNVPRIKFKWNMGTEKNLWLDVTDVRDTNWQNYHNINKYYNNPEGTQAEFLWSMNNPLASGYSPVESTRYKWRIWDGFQHTDDGPEITMVCPPYGLTAVSNCLGAVTQVQFSWQLGSVKQVVLDVSTDPNFSWYANSIINGTNIIALNQKSFSWHMGNTLSGNYAPSYGVTYYWRLWDGYNKTYPTPPSVTAKNCIQPPTNLTAVPNCSGAVTQIQFSWNLGTVQQLVLDVSTDPNFSWWANSVINGTNIITPGQTTFSWHMGNTLSNNYAPSYNTTYYWRLWDGYTETVAASGVKAKDCNPQVTPPSNLNASAFCYIVPVVKFTWTLGSVQNLVLDVSTDNQRPFRWWSNIGLASRATEFVWHVNSKLSDGSYPNPGTTYYWRLWDGTSWTYGNSFTAVGCP